MDVLLIIILAAPLLAALFGYIFRKGNAWPHIAGAALSFIASLLIFLQISKTETINFGGLAGQSFMLRSDYATGLFALVVSLVALAIFIYAKGYMREQKGKQWFWPAMSLFLTAMQLLVLAGDWFLFITGWEVMGLASFLLIGTWHERENARTGSVKAFMLTRFTDIGLYIGVFLIIISYGNFAIPFAGSEKITLTASLWMLLAVMGKSAQVPFQSWLSGAMAGPTPVSALLHSATMVGAGALLLIKINPLLPDEALFYVALVGSITIIFTGITAITSKDLKQMLAASTSSQLGFMLLALGTGHPGAAVAHWVAHAFMKSTLFLGAGIFQEGYEDTGYEKLAGSGKHLKYTLGAFAVAGISLAGIPPFIGYWSKDAILAGSYLSGNLFFALSGILGAFFTAVYMAKAIGILWRGENEAPKLPHKKWMLTGLTLLVIVILAGGFDLEHLVKNSGYEVPKDITSKIIGLTAAVTGLSAGWFYRENWLPQNLISFANTNYSIARGYRGLVARPVLKLADVFYGIDKGILDFILETGKSVVKLSKVSSEVDRHEHAGMLWIGGAALGISKLSEIFDAQIANSVHHVAEIVKKGGDHGKKWQSGLVHKELAITIIVLLVLIFVVLIISNTSL